MTDNQIKKQFPILTSIVGPIGQNDRNDLSSRLLSNMEWYLDYYKKIESTLSLMNPFNREYILNQMRNYKTRDELRGWPQFNSVLTEVEAYQYLVDKNAKKITFITEKSSPDLNGYIDKQLVLLEVKRILNSDNENQYIKQCIKKPTTRSFAPNIPTGLKNKIIKAVEKASSQLLCYRPQIKAKRIIFLKLNLDLEVHAKNVTSGDMKKFLTGIKTELVKNKIHLEIVVEKLIYE